MIRLLTFLDTNEVVSSNSKRVGLIIGFSLLAAASFVGVVQAILETRTKSYLKHTVRGLFPWVSLVMTIENSTHAVNTAYNIPFGWAAVVYVLQATVAPSLLISTFYATYIIHKTRHLPFCGLNDGQTQDKSPRRTLALKSFIWIVSLILLALGLCVNFNAGELASPYAGRTGWYYVITTRPWTVQHVHIILGLLPITIVNAFGVYFGFALWKYGTTSSMVVHSSPLNPWFTPLLGTTCLIVSQWFGPRLFPILSNLGIWIYVECILFLVLEINKDVKSASELNEFLQAFESIKLQEEKDDDETAIMEGAGDATAERVEPKQRKSTGEEEKVEVEP